MFSLLVAASTFILLTGGPGSSAGLLGDWREPSGSVIRIAPCGQHVCATLIAINPQSPETTDQRNPISAARAHPLCGLVIGKDFNLDNDQHADGGTLYDPKSGKTYRGEMIADGNTLRLRGYIGFKLFGRSETWTRVHQVTPCVPS